MKANKLALTHSKLRKARATKALLDSFQVGLRNRATGRDGGQRRFQNFASIKSRPRTEKAHNRRACLHRCTRGGGTKISLTRGGDNSSLARTLASIVAPVLACHWPLELTENSF